MIIQKQIIKKGEVNQGQGQVKEITLDLLRQNIMNHPLFKQKIDDTMRNNFKISKQSRREEFKQKRMVTQKNLLPQTILGKGSNILQNSLFQMSPQTVKQCLSSSQLSHGNGPHSVCDNIEFTVKKMMNSNEIPGGTENVNLRQFNREQSQRVDIESDSMSEPEDFSYTYSYLQNERKKDITILRHDLNKLLPNQYINDTIVNFFLKFLEIEILTEEMKEKVLIFNTYFMSKLAPNEQIEATPSTNLDALTQIFEKKYQTLRRWVKEDIFEKEILVFPLNLPEHWSVIIVVNPKGLFHEQQISSEMELEHADHSATRINSPCLLYFDSFGLLDQNYSNMVRLYLNKEFETKKKEQIKQNVFYDEHTLPSYQPLVYQ